MKVFVWDLLTEMAVASVERACGKPYRRIGEK